MKLIELVEYLLNPDKLAELYEKEDFNPDEDEILIYMKEKVDIESEIVFFYLDEAEDDLIYVKDGIEYHQLFPVQYAVELIESDLDLKGKGYSNTVIAERLIEYWKNDA
jgi:hypothetical protein